MTLVEYQIPKQINILSGHDNIIYLVNEKMHRDVTDRIFKKPYA